MTTLTVGGIDLDTEQRYTVRGYSGVAWYLLGQHVETWWEGDPENTFEIETDMVECVMVGDDRTFVVDATDLTELAESAYCHECGQIGCGWDVREEE